MRLLYINYREQIEEKHIRNKDASGYTLKPCSAILVPETESSIRASARKRAMYLKMHTKRIMKPLLIIHSITCDC